MTSVVFLAFLLKPLVRGLSIEEIPLPFPFYYTPNQPKTNVFYLHILTFWCCCLFSKHVYLHSTEHNLINYKYVLCYKKQCLNTKKELKYTLQTTTQRKSIAIFVV